MLVYITHKLDMLAIPMMTSTHLWNSDTCRYYTLESSGCSCWKVNLQSGRPEWPPSLCEVWDCNRLQQRSSILSFFQSFELHWAPIHQFRVNCVQISSKLGAGWDKTGTLSDQLSPSINFLTEGWPIKCITHEFKIDCKGGGRIKTRVWAHATFFFHFQLNSRLTNSILKFKLFPLFMSTYFAIPFGLLIF